MPVLMHLTCLQASSRSYVCVDVILQAPCNWSPEELSGFVLRKTAGLACAKTGQIHCIMLLGVFSHLGWSVCAFTAGC